MQSKPTQEDMKMLTCDDAIREHEYLVARGVRPMALIGQCGNSECEMLRAVTKLESLSAGKSIPFVIDCGNGVADYGYASHFWVVDLYKFIVNRSGSVPQEQRSRILGLLLGYSPEAISRFDETARGRILRDHCPTDSLLAESVST